MMMMFNTYTGEWKDEEIINVALCNYFVTCSFDIVQLGLCCAKLAIPLFFYHPDLQPQQSGFVIY